MVPKGCHAQTLPIRVQSFKLVMQSADDVGMDDQPVDIDALLRELQGEMGIEVPAQQGSPVTAAIERHSTDIGRYYADYRSSLSS